MKSISVSLVLSLFLFSCRAEQIQPPKEYRNFTNMLIDDAGKPVFTHVETMQGKDSVTVAVFVYEGEINWQEIDKNGMYIVVEKESPDDSSAHWVRSTVWDRFCDDDEHLEQIVKGGFSEEWMLGFRYAEPIYERFMIYKKNKKTFILYEVMH